MQKTKINFAINFYCQEVKQFQLDKHFSQKTCFLSYW